ncbi:uncharacterized protein LOC119608731 isoform X6 [Lucilia sericata]|uniref:uncharacterized protein LOC119608731 isoform X6 n=1 Tax=Lucilia sericata TaxID=13632 RepID=UPI0018A7F8D7|nr:uncharacterized protein LOC119608731 isoform X6 [Lucilia sericata]
MSGQAHYLQYSNFLLVPLIFLLCSCFWDWVREKRRTRRQRDVEESFSRNDRQGNNFATAEEAARDNRFNDIFFIEPNSPEAARIRAQLEKDDKDLPSYDEVMRMTNLSTPTAAPAAGAVNFVPAMPSALSMGASSSSVNTTDTTLTVPPYTSADPNVSSSSRPLTPPPYTPEPIGASVVLPITTPLHSQQPAQSS